MRLLLVEDDHRIAQALKKGLEQERYVVDVAYEGATGFDLASTEEYSVIILDRMLPQMDGLTLCSELRKQGNHTPVLMLTAKTQITDRVEGLNSGADDYLTKPFAFEELLARIRALVRRPPQVQQETLTVADVTLDPTTFAVMRSGVPIQLSAKEFSLLAYLMRHPRVVRTKEQIISQVWEYDANILPNTVEVSIRNLRLKVEKPFPQLPPFITTVRGFGYKVG